MPNTQRKRAHIISHQGNASEIPLPKWKRMIIPNVGKHVDHPELSNTAAGTIKWYKVWEFLIKLDMHQSHDPTIHLTGTYTRETTTFVHKNP